MRNLIRQAVILLALALLLPAVVRAQSGTIEEIRVQGLFRMSREAFLHALRVKSGDAYDEAVLRERFRPLWRLGLFEDIVFESEQTPQGGWLLVIKVKERPILSAVTYEDNSVVTRTAIEDRFKERDIELQLGKPYDPGAVVFAESAIRDLLAEKGHLNSEVEAQVRDITETTRAVHFVVTPGGKTRIRDVEFTGNVLFSDRKLKSTLELTQERRWYWPWSQKNLFHPVKWDQDAGNLRDLYLDRGYLDVQIQPPVVEVVRQKDGGDEAEAAERLTQAAQSEAAAASAAAQPADAEATAQPDERQEKRRKKELDKQRKREKKAKKIKRWVYLTVPVVEGPQYSLGEVEITGNTVFTDQILRPGLTLQSGDVIRNGAINTAVSWITQLYGDRGYLYANVVRQIQRREGENVADLTLEITEDKPYYVGRIMFSGNTATRDNVLRREVALNEGDLFSRRRLETSQRKINQLGYFQVPQDPLLEPVPEESRVNITIVGEEQGRNEIQVGGGYSGLEGAFFNGIYSTRNFLGRGQILSTAIQVGGRSNRYQISFQEPYFLNRPYLLGFSLFRRDIDFGASLSSTSTGAGIVLGKRLGRFTSLSVGYNWESVESRTVLTTAGSASLAQSITQQNRVSSVTPNFGYSTINNPYRPSGGRQFSMSFQIAGGPLGGDTSFLKPIGTFTNYRKGFGRSFFAVHVEGGLVREWQDGSAVTGSNIEGIPRFQRFWLGGDTLGPRVFETRSITPLRYVELIDGVITRVLGDPRYVSVDDLVTNGGIPIVIEVGGDRFYLVQSEYVFPLNEQVEVAAFLDVGNVLFEDQSFGFDTARVAAGVEIRFHLPIFPVPLRLIYGVPVREVEGDRTSNFTFSIGRSF